MSAITERVRRFQKAEYTGDNRCLPCTIVNLVIAAALGVAVGLVFAPAGVAVFLVGVLAIALRGYLVPGTPSLTKRYFPDSVLRLFDKHERPATSLDDEAFDVETILLDAGVVTECRNGTDLCLTDEFETAWYDRIEARRDGDDQEGIEDLFDSLDVELDRVSVEDHGNAYVALVDEMRVGQWESRAAYLADLAAMPLLKERAAAWPALGFEQRTEVLGALRLWLDRCPECDGRVTLGEETVESCCRSIDVIAATCDDCGSRVFEAQYSPEQLA